MKIIILGATGFLGRETTQAALRRGHGIVAHGCSSVPAFRSPQIVRTIQTDLSNAHDTERLVLHEFPDAIVNCTALASARACAENPVLSEQLNTDLPGRLAQLAHHLGARLVHLSSAEVFGTATGPHSHTDNPEPSPGNAFAQAKLAGEKEALRHGRSNVTVLRIPLLSGNSHDGTRSFHERLFALWAHNRATPLPANEHIQPLSVTHLAETLIELCERPNLSGVYHWAGADATSPHAFAQRIARHFGLDPAPLVTPADATSPRDHRLHLHPLQGKLKTHPPTMGQILDELRVPPQHTAWHSATTGRAPAPERLVKGIHF
ncbi:MAG: sugar nucleotide-binding protein [Puniceicoccales bacterium]|jgi:dTDP-4-dehydrorhamnose reductase|nr:sugar nucleotide-binding protein [Puniceicoccales bacterium]